MPRKLNNKAFKTYTEKNIELFLADCFDVLPLIAGESIDLILCDLPYNSSNCTWDKLLPLDKLWKQYERIIKPNGVIILTATQPFASQLVMSNLNLFKYELIWDKIFGVSAINSKFRPMNAHENILVFYKRRPVFNPIFLSRETTAIRKQKKKMQASEISQYAYITKNTRFTESKKKNPVSIITINRFAKECNPKNRIHPTQKPEALMEYLIKTFTNKNYLVMDNCFGSGSTVVACKKLNRKFIGVEKEKKYFNMAKKRLKEIEK